MGRPDHPLRDLRDPQGGKDLDLESPTLHARAQELDRCGDALAGQAYRRDARAFEQGRDERIRAVADGRLDGRDHSSTAAVTSTSMAKP